MQLVHAVGSRRVDLMAGRLIFSSCTTTTKNMALHVETCYFVRLSLVEYRSTNQVSRLIHARKQVPSVEHGHGGLYLGTG